MKRRLIPQLSQKAIAINLGAGLVMVAGFISFVHTTFARPHVEVCSTRYHRQLIMRLDKDGTPLTPNDVQAISNGQDEGLLDNLSIAQFSEGPVKYAMGVRLQQGTAEQRSNTSLPGGISLPWMPSALEQPTAACLSYKVFLPADFAFDQGGTLPGLFGATINGQYGDTPSFGANLSWQAGGAPRFYLKIKSEKDERTAAFNTYDRTLPLGRWINVEQELVLNTPNQPDGVARLWLDGKLETEVKQVDIRATADVAISGVAGDIFFGGSATHGKAPKDATIWLSAFDVRWK